MFFPVPKVIVSYSVPVTVSFLTLFERIYMTVQDEGAQQKLEADLNIRTLIDFIFVFSIQSFIPSKQMHHSKHTRVGKVSTSKSVVL